MVDISISIVTYNSEKIIGNLLTSLYEHTKENSFAVYVIDNGSSDNTVSLIKNNFPQVKLIEQENKGFGGGHNAVLSQLDSKYHAMINPDIVFQSDALHTLFTYMEEHEDVVIGNPLIHNPDGTRQEVPCKQPTYRYAFSREMERFGGPFKKWRDEYTMRTIPFEQPIDVEFCTGCFIFIRTALFKELNGFDERFFMYCEDADLTRRAMQHGRAVCVATATVVHDWERASGHNWKLFRIHLSSIQKYFKKWRKGTA